MHPMIYFVTILANACKTLNFDFDYGISYQQYNHEGREVRISSGHSGKFNVVGRDATNGMMFNIEIVTPGDGAVTATATLNGETIPVMDDTGCNTATLENIVRLCRWYLVGLDRNRREFRG